jgi:hypothetical protein
MSTDATKELSCWAWIEPSKKCGRIRSAETEISPWTVKLNLDSSYLQ